MIYRTLLINHLEDFTNISLDVVLEHNTNTTKTIKDLKSSLESYDLIDVFGETLIEDWVIISQGITLNDDDIIENSITNNQLLIDEMKDEIREKYLKLFYNTFNPRGAACRIRKLIEKEISFN